MNFFKILPLAMMVLAEVGTAVDPTSEGGEKVTTLEAIKIGVKAAVAATVVLKVPTEKIEDTTEIVEAILQELRASGLVN